MKLPDMILLNGSSSSGKTSISRSLQELLPVGYLSFSVDDTFSWLPMRWHNSEAGFRFIPQANGELAIVSGPEGLSVCPGSYCFQALLDARWEHVDVERRAWLIPTSKTGKPRHVPLSAAALAIVAALPRYKDCPWLVPNPDTRKPFVSIKHGWQRAIKVAKLPGLRIHDLRHSAASFMVNGGVDLFAVGKVLGHASYQSTQRYSHLANDTLLAAVEAGAAKQNAA